MKKIIIILLIIVLSSCSNNSADVTGEKYIFDNQNNISADSINSVGNVGDFEFAFLKFENIEENKIYSPLSIKYALAMLDEGTKGNSKAQIDAVLGDFEPNKYTNSENLSLANLFVIKNSLSDIVSTEFKDAIKEKYDAEILIETFENPNVVNKWISEKTFGMIEDYINQFNPETKFLIINALAMDMDWINKLNTLDPFYYSGNHENYYCNVSQYNSDFPPHMNFNGEIVEGLYFATYANKYDILGEIGEEEIKKIVKEDIKDAMSEFDVLSELSSRYGGSSEEEIINNYLKVYIEELKDNYGNFGTSTDFYFYDDDNVKVFAKDLKEYNDAQFQYVGIMPKNERLTNYIDNLNAEDISTIVNNLVKPTFDYFEEGYITEIKGTVPTFEFSYDLSLDNDLNRLGITDIFDSTKANLSKIIGDELVSIEASHKSTIEFSNDGIKASAVTMVSGIGAMGGYDYRFEVPIKTIDLTFDKPFMFLIRNKNTGDIWFVGTVYEGKLESSASIRIEADVINIRKDPSSSSDKIGMAKKYDYFEITGDIVEADGYTWYEIIDGGWIADDNGEWVNIQ